MRKGQGVIENFDILLSKFSMERIIHIQSSMSCKVDRYNCCASLSEYGILSSGNAGYTSGGEGTGTAEHGKLA